MTTWEYRVIWSNGGYGIHEVYYDDSGGIRFWTETPCEPVGNSIRELQRELVHMYSATLKDELDITDLENRE